MNSNISAAIQKIRRIAARDAQRNGAITKVAVIYNLVFFPFALGMLTGNYSALTAVSWWPFWLPMSIVGLIAIILGAVQLLGPANAVSLYFEAKEIIDHAQDLSEDRERTLRIARAATVSNSAVLSWISSVPGYILPGIGTREQMEEAAAEVVSQLVENRKDLFGIVEADELWNFAVYLFDRENQCLAQIYREKHPDHPGKPIGRNFRPGQGHIGKAFADRVAKITADSEAPDVRNLMDAAPELQRGYDAWAYRSYASIPIGTDQVDGNPYGVIVATSNRIERFNLDNANVLRMAAGILANIIELSHYNFQMIPDGPEGAISGTGARL